FREWSVEDWQKAVNANMLTPIMLIKATVDGMCERKFGRIVNITSGSVKSPIPNLGMSNGARAGLTAFCAGLARQVAKYNVTINGLLPGPFLTDRLRSGIEYEARRQNISFEEMLAKRGHSNPTGRVGDPAEFGDACAFLCAASSGFIVGQNLLLDGGAFNSTMGYGRRDRRCSRPGCACVTMAAWSWSPGVSYQTSKEGEARGGVRLESVPEGKDRSRRLRGMDRPRRPSSFPIAAQSLRRDPVDRRDRMVVAGPGPGAKSPRVPCRQRHPRQGRAARRLGVDRQCRKGRVY